MTAGTGAVARPVVEVRAQALAILRAVGVPERAAAVVADALVDADRRGLTSHGLLRLPLYVEAVEAGGIAADPQMTWAVEQGATATLDAADGFGQVAMDLAVEKAAELVGAHGVAAVAVRRSGHYGTGTYWTDRLAARGYAAVLSSTTGASVAPYGAAQAFIGTNPLTITFPTSTAPLTADLATSAGAYGRIVQAAETGAEIPPGWAIDGGGAPTTDARAALGGALVPFGGHKGSAIATMLEVFAAAGAGGNFAHEATDIWADRSAHMRMGHLLLAFDPGVLAGDAAPLDRAGAFRDRLRALPAADPAAPVLAPGDLEAANLARAQDEVSLPANVDEGLRTLASRLGVG